MTDLERLVHDLIARVDALERQNDSMGQQNARLLAEISALREPGAATSATRDESPPASLNRRQVLQRGLQVAAATVAAGVVVHETTPDAAATHSAQLINASAVVAHYVEGIAVDDHSGVLGKTSADGADEAGVVGINTSTSTGGYAIGVLGTGRVGVRGISNTDTGFGNCGVFGKGRVGVYGSGTDYGKPGVLGSHYQTDGSPPVDGPGVIGEGVGDRAEDAGVIGMNGESDGVRGEGKTGVRGVSQTGQGVFGEGGTGYGGIFKGARAQLRLTPTGRIGKPTTGYHQIGELYLDKVGALFLCTAAGTPGTWRKVSTIAN